MNTMRAMLVEKNAYERYVQLSNKCANMFKRTYMHLTSGQKKMPREKNFE